MEAIECIKTRRSVRRFTEEPVTKELVNQIIETAAYAPSWKNTQVVRYHVLRDPEKLAVLERIAAKGVTIQYADETP